MTGFKNWTVYRESASSPWTFEVDQDMSLGASFTETSELEEFHVIEDVVYAQPGVKPLKYDVYIPDGAEQLPGVFINGKCIGKCIGNRIPIHPVEGWDGTTSAPRNGLISGCYPLGRFCSAKPEAAKLKEIEGR